MNNNVITVISLGNYESKIFCCSVSETNEILPIYIDSFITKDFFYNSDILDEDLFKKTLTEKIALVPLDINETKVILNIPIKKINIVNFSSDEYIINSTFTEEKWEKIEEGNSSKFLLDNYVKLDQKNYVWLADGKEYLKPPFNKNVYSLSYKAKIFNVPKQSVDNFLNLFSSIRVKVSSVVTDSLALYQLFQNPERRFKLLLNIGHLESSFELYDNKVLVSQEKIDIGIRHLTSEISKFLNINEKESIYLLKEYRDIVLVDKEVTLVNIFSERFFEHKEIKVKEINFFIINWLRLLIEKINIHIQYIFSLSYDVDEIYIFASTNIFETWINYIQPKLIKFCDVKTINAEVIGVEQSKFFSLIATVLSFVGS